MFCFPFPILPTSSCLFNGNYLQILCGEAIYINKNCILNWFSFSFLLQIYLPSCLTTHIHHWSHSSPDCLLQLKKLPTPKAGCAHSTRKTREQEVSPSLNPPDPELLFFQTVPKKTWQETKSCCWTAMAEDGCMALLAACCLSPAPQQ